MITCTIDCIEVEGEKEQSVLGFLLRAETAPFS